MSMKRRSTVRRRNRMKRRRRAQDRRHMASCCKQGRGSSSWSSVRLADYLGVARFLLDVFDRLGQWGRHLGN